MLKTGVAYHGNRILKHVEEDLNDIINHNFNLVVHMFSHNDWDRHHKIMKEIFDMTLEKGLELWVDNWGIGGPPGDKSHFLAYYPEAHQVYNDGTNDPVRACYNNEDFRRFTREWIDVVYDCGGRIIFWDEPHLVGREIRDGKPTKFTCCCNVCKKLFKDIYGFEMPSTFTDEVAEFRVNSIVDYFKHVTEYSASKGMTNTVCVMLGEQLGIHLKNIDKICSLPSLHNIGSDPYWYGSTTNSYDFVYKGTKKNLDICKQFNKDHNIWIQGFGVPAGREEEIIYATDAAYDAGARTILFWSFRGAESNTYRSVNPELVWKTAGDAMRRIQDRYRDENLAIFRTMIKDNE